MSEAPKQPEENTSGLHARALAWGGAALLAGIGFALAAAWFAQDMLRPAAGYAGPNAPGVAVPTPALEPAPQPARAAFEAEKQHLVSSYGWVDRQAGIARIPVEQAMQLMAERAAKEKSR